MVSQGVVKVVRVGTGVHWLSFVCSLGWRGSEEDAWLLLGLRRCLSHELTQCLCAKESEAPILRVNTALHRDTGHRAMSRLAGPPAQSYATVLLQ